MGIDMGIDMKNYTITNDPDRDDVDESPILEDEEIVDQIREMLSLGYSQEDIAYAAKWVDENTEWIEE